MKFIRSILLSAPVLPALILLAAPVSARADTATEKPLSKTKQAFDLDHDGKLNDDEEAAAKAATKAKAKATREANLAKYDANKNGKLDDDERAKKRAEELAAREARRATRDAAKAAKEEAKR